MGGAGGQQPAHLSPSPSLEEGGQNCSKTVLAFSAMNWWVSSLVDQVSHQESRSPRTNANGLQTRAQHGSGPSLHGLSGTDACSCRESIPERRGGDRGGSFKSLPRGVGGKHQGWPFCKASGKKREANNAEREERINPSLTTNRADKEQIIRIFGGNGLNT